MDEMTPVAAPSPVNPASGAPLPALRFWERGRLFCNAILTAVVLIWLFANWTHFRPGLTLGSLVAMLVLALLANVCYTAAYLAEIPIQQLLPRELWNRLRWAVWLLGMLLALVLENYWIADEIYPGGNEGGAHPLQEVSGIWTPHFASNINFPAPLAALGFLSASVGLFLAVASVSHFLVRPQAEAGPPRGSCHRGWRSRLFRASLRIFRRQSHHHARPRPGEVFLRD
jgi:hypothetical protein